MENGDKKIISPQIKKTSEHIFPRWKDRVIDLAHHYGEAGVSNPDAVRIVVAAFDDAWRSIQTSGASLISDVQIGRTQLMLARRIIELAKLGERDQRRLCEDALLYLAQASVRNSPLHERYFL